MLSKELQNFLKDKQKILSCDIENFEAKITDSNLSPKTFLFQHSDPIIPKKKHLDL